MRLGNLIKAIYYSDKPLTEKDYIFSRNLSIFEGGSARTMFNLTSGAFLAGYASFLGADDSFNGIIGAIPVLAGIIQMISPIIFERMEKRKLLISLFAFLHRLLLASLVFIPVLLKGQSSRLALLAVVYFLSYLAISFINPAVSGWIIDLIPESIRGRYFGIRESYVLGAATIFTLIMGRVLDAFKAKGNEYGGFIAVFVFVGILALINFIALSYMKEPPVKRNKSELNLKKVVTIPLKDKKFTKIILLFIFWNIGVQIGGPFFSVYMVTGLKLNYTFIMIMGTLGTLTNVILVRLWGRLADKKSWIYVTKMSILILAVSHFIWFFINQQTASYLVPLMHISGGAAWAGIGISTFNIQFQYSPEEGRTVYIGFNAALCGLIGFLSTLLGSFILSMLNEFRLDLAGFTIGGMQMIFCFSGILLAICVLYIHLFLKPSES